MKQLFEIINEGNLLKAELAQEEKDYKAKKDNLISRISILQELEQIGSAGMNLEMIQIAETILEIHGDPYGRTSDVVKFGSLTIAEKAINDIASGCQHLKKEYFGNKQYEGFYQNSNHTYGYGPRHGSTVDEVGLRRDILDKELSDEEKNACIYYLKNYTKIKELATSPQQN